MTFASVIERHHVLLLRIVSSDLAKQPVEQEKVSERANEMTPHKTLPTKYTIVYDLDAILEFDASET
jgi:hypothetical protein